MKFAFPFILCVAVCAGAHAQSSQESSQDNTDAGQIKVSLTPQLPSSDQRMNWSPKGKQLQLTEDAKGRLVTTMQLGPESNAKISLALEKFEGSEHFNRLRVDIDGNGLDESDKVIACEPRELRGKIWSSFEVDYSIPFPASDDRASDDPASDDNVLKNPVRLNFWYVADPSEDEASTIIRYNIAGWMHGSLQHNEKTIHVLLYDYTMDGIFTRADSWSLATDDDEKAIYQVASNRPTSEYNWAGEKAFQVVSIDENGRGLQLRPYDPGISRAEDAKQRDAYARDRTAKRSGKQVEFLHEFAEARSVAAEKGVPIFLDFETTWCGPCKIMDQLVYTADTVVEASDGWVAVKIDGDLSKDLVEKYGVSAYPTIVLINADGTLITKAQGYQSVESMTKMLTEHK